MPVNAGFTNWNGYSVTIACKDVVVDWPRLVEREVRLTAGRDRQVEAVVKELMKKQEQGANDSHSAPYNDSPLQQYVHSRSRGRPIAAIMSGSVW